MSWSTLHNAIKTKLDARTGSGQVLAAAYKSHSVKPSGYPYATVEPSSREEDYLTLNDNRATYVFDIVVHQEMEQVGEERAIEIVEAVLDQLEKDLRDDYTLSGAAHVCRPAPGEWGEYPEESGWVKYGSLKLSCEVDKQ